MIKGSDPIFEMLAEAGYETMFDSKWKDLPAKSKERQLWLNIARNMLKALWSICATERLNR